MHQRISKKGVILSFILLWTVALTIPATAQLLDSNQPEQDACNAISLCGKAFTSTYSYQGVGLKNDITGTPCGSAEANSVWLKIVVQTSGKLVFQILPLDVLDDYDFAVIKSNDCANLTYDQVVRCNFNNNLTGSNVNGIVGLSESSNEPYIQSGATGHSFAQAIDATAGETYYIMINNFGHLSGNSYTPSAGFTVDFANSSALFENTSAPELDTIATACDYSRTLRFSLTNYAKCGSIAADGSDIVVKDQNGNIYPVTSAYGVNCSQSDGYTKEVSLQFSQTLPNGSYTLQVQKGSDGNTIMGLCDAEMLTTEKPLSFSVLHDSLKLVSLDSPACKTIHLIFNQTVNCNTISSDGSQFYITGPSHVAITAATALTSCVDNGTSGIELTLSESIRTDGSYVLHSKTDNPVYGTCGNILNYDIAQSFTIQSYNGLVQLMPDTTVCRLGDSIPLTYSNSAIAPSGGFAYVWLTDNSTESFATGSSIKVAINKATERFILETTDANNCILRDSVTIKIEPYEVDLSPKQATICANDSLVLEVIGDAIQYQWFSDNLLQKTATNLSSTNIKTTMFYPDTAGLYTYYVLATSRKQCLDTLSATIGVITIPALTLVFRDTTIQYGTDIQLIASGADQYQWTPMQWINNSTASEPIAHPIKNITYIVKGTNNNSCATTDSVKIKIFYKDYAFFPSGFTPNKDGKNDIFKPTFFGNINNYKLLIFNRWGKLIFQSNTPSIGWDGTIGNQVAPSGTYVWECQYQPEGENSYSKKGTIVLVR